MVQEVRSGTAGFVCDLSTTTGVAAALALLRNSSLQSDEKRSLRDLIFLYTNSGAHDEALRTLIESRLAPLASTPLVAEAEPAPVVSVSVDTPATPEPVSTVVRSGFATGRPKPTFTPLTPVNVPALTVASVVEHEPVVIPAPVSVAEVVPEVKTPAPSVPVVSAPTPAAVIPAAKAVVDEKLASVAPAPQDTVAYEPLYHEDTSIETYRNRISEIKRTINARVGNPVNLVDIDNTLGREYMTTLLEAMKTVSGGGGDVMGTMKRLEVVYAAVMKRLDSDSSATSTSAAVPESAPVTAEAPNRVVSTPQITPVIPKKAEPSVAVTATQAVAVKVSQPVIPSTTVSVPESVEAATEPASVTSERGYSVQIHNEDKTEVDPMTIASSRFKNVAPVSTATPLKTPQDLPTAADVKTRMGIVDPLEDPDVDLGLDQLLSEWSLFKKSGMFGTGPRGRQHPLYMKLAPLTIPLILSGRFEGATPEIKQSVTDYMNGWRYEQGIIHNPDETFEHYLRRVIRHIIDSQTRRRSA